MSGDIGRGLEHLDIFLEYFPTVVFNPFISEKQKNDIFSTKMNTFSRICFFSDSTPSYLTETIRWFPKFFSWNFFRAFLFFKENEKKKLFNKKVFNPMINGSVLFSKILSSFSQLFSALLEPKKNEKRHYFQKCFCWNAFFCDTSMLKTAKLWILMDVGAHVFPKYSW